MKTNASLYLHSVKFNLSPMFSVFSGHTITDIYSTLPVISSLELITALQLYQSSLNDSSPIKAIRIKYFHFSFYGLLVCITRLENFNRVNQNQIVIVYHNYRFRFFMLHQTLSMIEATCYPLFSTNDESEGQVLFRALYGLLMSKETTAATSI